MSAEMKIETRSNEYGICNEQAIAERPRIGGDKEIGF